MLCAGFIFIPHRRSAGIDGWTGEREGLWAASRACAIDADVHDGGKCGVEGTKMKKKKTPRKPQVKADVRYWWSGRLADTELLPNYRSPPALAAPPAQWQAARGIMASQMQSWKIPLAAGDRERGCHRQSVVRFISVGGPGRNFSIIHRFPCAGGRLDCWPPSLSVCARPGMWGTGRGGGERGRGRCRLF